jgi:hypothetical protein
MYVNISNSSIVALENSSRYMDMLIRKIVQFTAFRHINYLDILACHSDGDSAG